MHIYIYITVCVYIYIHMHLIGIQRLCLQHALTSSLQSLFMQLGIRRRIHPEHFQFQCEISEHSSKLP